MKKWKIVSKVHGTKYIILDDEDFFRLERLGGKWSVTKKRNGYYAQKRINGKIIEIQRFLLNPPKGMYVDHINHDGLDNRRSNLRMCTNSANLRNGKLRPNNTSGHTGVWRDKRRNKWVAEIKVNYKKISLGRFDRMEDAIKSRLRAQKKYWSS